MIVQPAPWPCPDSEEAALALYRAAMAPLGTVEAFYGAALAHATPEHWSARTEPLSAPQG